MNCSICGSNVEDIKKEKSRDGHEFECPKCGRYEISDSLYRTKLSEIVDLKLLSSVIRHLSERGERVTLTSDLVEQVIESVRPPSHPFEQIDLILDYIYSKTKRVGRNYVFKNDDFPMKKGQRLLSQCGSIVN